MSADQNERIKQIHSLFEKNFSGKDPKAGTVISAPGRMEILGNHTDHQHGYVLTAAVNLDTLGIAVKNDTGVITLYSDGFPAAVADTRNLDIIEAEKNTSDALIRGVADGFSKHGYQIGGFDACTVTDVLKGSGLSSSAAFEVWVAAAINELYNDGKADPIEIARICQYAENVHFGKPSGLQDQMASSVGGILFIDFNDTENPVVEKLSVELTGYSICIIDSGANHADLTGEYAAIPQELKAVSGHFGESWLRPVNQEHFFAALPELRKKYGDRAILRAFHIYEENERVLKAKQALQNQNIPEFFKYVRKSGESSFMYLQNVSVSGDIRSQELAVTLAVAENILGDRGAFRIQGGGFAGTVEAFVPNDLLSVFISRTESVLGAGSCHVLSIREQGAGRID